MNRTATAAPPAEPGLLTWEQFLAMPESDGGHEFIDGRIRPKMPPTLNHGLVVGKVMRTLEDWADPEDLGYAVPEVMFRIRRVPTSRGKLPDVAFVRSGRMAGRDGHAAAQDMVPDLAVEVLSPSDRPVEVADKVAEYLDAGTPLVWVVDPQRRDVVVHRPGEAPRTYDGADVLEGFAELPGFSCPAGAFFVNLREADDDG